MPTRLDVKARACIAASCLLLPGGAALAQSSGVQWKTIQGYRVGLSVESLYETAPPGTNPKHASVLEHRLRVSVLDEKTRRAAPIKSAAAYVAEMGHKGATIPLTAVSSRENISYEGRIALATRAAYGIAVQVTPLRGHALEAQFDYRHHH